MIFGVSPAYFLSVIGKALTPASVNHELPEVCALGYTGFEVEVVEAELLPAWERDTGTVARVSEGLGLHVPQVVGHFLIDMFSTAEQIRGFNVAEHMNRLCDVAGMLPDCATVVIPVGPFTPTNADLAAAELNDLWNRLAEQVWSMSQIVASRRLQLSLEIQPGALIAGSAGYVQLCRELGTTKVGYNFDTGHARAMKECVELIPARLSDAITGTHLCDNFGFENLSLAPGAGTVSWTAVLQALYSAAYSGPLDVEIFCSADSARSEYERARRFLTNIAAEVGFA